MKMCECGCGSPAPIAKMTMTKRGWVKGQPQRFVRGHTARVSKRKGEMRIEHNVATGCYEWQGATVNGYGVIKHKQKQSLAHRFVYEIFVGKIPKNGVMDHLCYNPLCVNPDHLRVTDSVGNSHTSRATKLNSEAVKVLRAMKGKVHRQILAAIYGIRPKYVNAIQHGDWWKVLA